MSKPKVLGIAQPRMSAAQHKEIRSRLDRAKSHHYSGRKVEAKPPPDVIAARKVVKRYEAQLEKEERKRSNRIKAAYAHARDIAFLGDPNLALKAVGEFEKMKF